MKRKPRKVQIKICNFRFMRNIYTQFEYTFTANINGQIKAYSPGGEYITQWHKDSIYNSYWFLTKVGLKQWKRNLILFNIK